MDESNNDETVDALRGECRRIVNAAFEGRNKIIVTCPEIVAQPLVLFASQGDAWMLEPSEGLALCLRFNSQDFSPSIGVRQGKVLIAWDGEFKLQGPVFAVHSTVGDIGTRDITGYGLDALRAAIDRTQDFDSRFAGLFMQPDAVELTPQVIEQLVSDGKGRAMLEDYARDGLRYLPSRDSFMLAPVSNFDDDE